MNGTVMLAASTDDPAVLVREEREDGATVFTYASPDCSFREAFGPEGAKALAELGEDHLLGFFELAAQSRESDLAKIERGVVELAAGNATDSTETFLDNEKVAAFAARRGLSFGEARQKLRTALVGDEDQLKAAMIERYCQEKGVPFVDGAAELAAAGALDRRADEQGVPINSAGGDDDEKARDAKVKATLHERGLDMSHYGDVANELAAAGEI